MSMAESYTIISGTNRPGSNTYLIALQYQTMLGNLGVEANVLSLEGLELGVPGANYQKIEHDLLIPTMKFIFIAPEYNGSIPGVLKMLLDVSDYRKVWWGKKALLTGISTGRSGNVRGLEHLTSILNYMKVFVHPNKLPISIVDKLMPMGKVIEEPGTLAAIESQLKDFIAF